MKALQMAPPLGPDEALEADEDGNLHLVRGRTFVLGCQDHVDERGRLPYLQWHSWAEQAIARGEIQHACLGCGLWIASWEMRPGCEPGLRPVAS